MKTKTLAAILFASLFALAPLGAAETPGTTVGSGKPPSDKALAEESYLEQAKRLLEALTSKSKEITVESKEWLKEDFKRIGDWEYKQEALLATKIKGMSALLNKNGAERWDCFWIQKEEGMIHLFFKRPAISYSQKVLTADLLKLLNTSGE